MQDIKDQIRDEKLIKYSALENKLMKMISDSGNEELMNTFLDWQKVRNELNAEWFSLASKYFEK